MKVYGSETLDYVVDEGLQSFGGYGYTQEYPMERTYRDSRINRIFEGTNEINRMVITGMLMKKGLKGELKLMDAIKAIQKEITDFPTMAEETGELLEHEQRVLQNAKKAILLIAGAAIQKFGPAVEEEQEILAMVADCIIAIYVLESTILRALKIVAADNGQQKSIYTDIARVLCLETAQQVESWLKVAAAAIYEGDDLRVLLSAVKRFTKYVPPNVKELRRNVAKHLIEAGKYLC
jgi:alkylation response protein AidB-like acyl-CoA dehydrogenase